MLAAYPRKWMARVGNLGSGALSFAAAKEEAIRLYSSRAKGGSDWTRELNVRTAAEIDKAALATDKRQTPVNFMGGKRHGHIDSKLRNAVLDAEIGFLSSTTLEAIQGDDYPLEYYEDGYPELPARLDRRHKPTLAEAA
jgi:hypothetical protein